MLKSRSFCASRAALCLVWLTFNGAAPSRRLVLRNIHLSRTRIRVNRRRSMSTTSRDNHSINNILILYESSFERMRSHHGRLSKY